MFPTTRDAFDPPSPTPSTSQVSVIYHDPERVQKRSTEARGARPYVRFVIAARRERTMPRWEESHTHSHDEFPRALACSSPTATPLLPGRRHELPNGCRSHRARVRTDPSCWRPVINKWRLAAYFVRRVASAGPDGAPSPFLTMSALAPPCGPRRAAHVQLPGVVSALCSDG